MKRFIYAVLMLGALARPAMAQLSGYTNFGQVTSPPNIDATNFVNLGLFNFQVSLYENAPFDFSDVATYTNRGVMADDNGFLFDTASPNQFPFPLRQQAQVVANQNPGQILASVEFPPTSTLNASLFIGSLPPILSVWAKNVTNTGIFDVGSTGLITMTGNNLDLRSGTLNVEGLGQLQANGVAANGVLVGGMFDEGWAVSSQTNVINTNTILAPLSTAPYIFQSPSHTITLATGGTESLSFEIENAVFAAYTNNVSDSNTFTQVVIAGDALGLVNVSVGFDTSLGTDPAAPVITWQGVSQGRSGLITNTIYLADLLGPLTNTSLFTNSTSLTGQPLLVPTNYQFLSTAFPDPISPGNTPYALSLFRQAFTPRRNETNVYTALEVNMDAVTSEPDFSVPGSTYSNQPGRIELTAQTLNLSNATVEAANFLNLNVTNFVGNPSATVEFSRASLNLGNTNGRLTLTNLVPPTIPLFSGPIECYSAMWTNIIQVTNITGPSTNLTTNVFARSNVFTVTMVSSELEPDTTVLVQDLNLKATNLVISDTLVVVSNFLADAQNITITANGPGALSPYGVLELESIDDLWTPYLPSLQNLTNGGLIFVINSVFFENRHNLNFDSPNDTPLQSFVNTGILESDGGEKIWANSFQNTGPSPVFGLSEIFAEFGPIFIQSPTAVFAGSDTVAENGDMQITAGSLVLSNVVLQAANSLILSATNFISDEGGLSQFSAGDGVSALILPSAGPAINSLRSTIINSTTLPNVQSENVWAGRPSPLVSVTTPGFTNQLPAMPNNAPIGEMILTGESSNSVFHFSGADSSTPYAMYVDLLDLEGGAVTRQNIGGTNIWTGLNVDPNMTIYFLDAVTTNGIDISEKLNGANGGRLIWVSNYVGQFSSTLVTYPDGHSFTFNRALAQSLTIDSDGDGLVNGIDSTPFPEPVTAQVLQLGAKTRLQAGTTMVDISWTAPAYSTNTLQYRSMPATNWLTFTNFTQGPADGTRVVTDSVQTNSRQYRLLVNPLQ